VFDFAKAALKFPGVDAANKKARPLPQIEGQQNKILALLGQDWQRATYLYGKNLKLYFCPVRVEAKADDVAKVEKQAQRDKVADELGMPHSGEPYTLNKYVDGLKLAELAEPARTVLFYEGEDGKLDFRHDGRADVAFADGHVETVGPDDVLKLIWNPKGKAK
jgi:prepilin-type processing-associated H-X9-DG protein